jgi:hypothetical protein
VVYLSAAGDVNADSLQWLAVKRGLKTNFNADPMSDKIEAQLQAMRAADVIVALEPGVRSVFYPFFPSVRVTGEILRALKEDADFVPVDRIPTPDGKYLFVFINNPFRGLTAESGMAAIEGPFPEANLPRFRWGLGNETRMIPAGVHPGAVTISGSGMSYIPNQQMILRIGQNVVGTVDFPETKKFLNFTFAAKLENPSDPIIISYATWDHANSVRPAVLFQRLTITN